MAHSYERISGWLTDRRVGLIVMVLVLTPIFVPIAIPLIVSPQTRDFYDEIMKRQRGDVVIVSRGIGMVAPRSQKTGMSAILELLYKQGLRIIFTSFEVANGPLFYEQYVRYTQPERYGYVYGRDYVILPLMSGGEPGLAALAANMWFFTTDFRGIPMKDLPLMQDVHTINDVSLVIFSVNDATFSDSYVRQWATKYPHLRMISFYTYNTVAPYYGKQIVGCLDATRGMAEFEYITSFLQGEELLTYSCRNLSVGFVLAATIAVNISFLYSRRRKPPTIVPSEVNGQ